MNQKLTPMSYLQELTATSWNHRVELAAAVAGALAIVFFSLIRFGEHALVILSGAVCALVVFEAMRAAWRVHRHQHFALSTTRLLLDLNAFDRSQFERDLREKHQRTEARLQEQHAEHVKGLEKTIRALQSDIFGRSHRKVAV